MLQLAHRFAVLSSILNYCYRCHARQCRQLSRLGGDALAQAAPVPDSQVPNPLQIPQHPSVMHACFYAFCRCTSVDATRHSKALVQVEERERRGDARNRAMV